MDKLPKRAKAKADDDDEVTKPVAGEDIEAKLEWAVLKACEGPPVMVGGVVSDVGSKTVMVTQMLNAVIGKLRIAGVSWGQILTVIGQIGFFIAEHGEDIEAIVQAILALLGRGTTQE